MHTSLAVAGEANASAISAGNAVLLSADAGLAVGAVLFAGELGLGGGSSHGEGGQESQSDDREDLHGELCLRADLICVLR